jgi:hypothetical protein
MGVRTGENLKQQVIRRFRRKPPALAGANLVFISIPRDRKRLARPHKLLAGKEPPNCLKCLS